MSEGLHLRAEWLIAQDRIEGLSELERSELIAHLAACERCSAKANETSQALAALRSVPIEIPRDLAARTQWRVRMRAEELREREPANRLLWVLTFLSWALGVASAPLVWRGFAWFGEWAGLPKPVWEIGVVLWWAVPALIAAGVVLMERLGRPQETE
jgi:anti-sigma factor RsiW